jgi:hypothetical protein
MFNEKVAVPKAGEVFLLLKQPLLYLLILQQR